MIKIILLFSLLRQWSIWNQSRLCVCVCVCQRSHSWNVWRTDPKFGGGIDFDNISDEFEGQGHRSKVKITSLKKVISEVSDGLVFVLSAMTRLHVASHHDVFWQKNLQRGHNEGGAVNARAFSLHLFFYTTSCHTNEMCTVTDAQIHRQLDISHMERDKGMDPGLQIHCNHIPKTSSVTTNVMLLKYRCSKGNDCIFSGNSLPCIFLEAEKSKKKLKYCRMPARWGLRWTALPPGSDETRTRDPLVS